MGSLCSPNVGGLNTRPSGPKQEGVAASGPNDCLASRVSVTDSSKGIVRSSDWSSFHAPFGESVTPFVSRCLKGPFRSGKRVNPRCTLWAEQAVEVDSSQLQHVAAPPPSYVVRPGDPNRGFQIRRCWKVGKPGWGSEPRTFRNIYSVGADERVRWERCWVKTSVTAVIFSLCPGSCVGSILLIDLSPPESLQRVARAAAPSQCPPRPNGRVMSLKAQGRGGQSGWRRAVLAFTLIQSESDQTPTPTVCCQRGTLKAK